MQKRVKNRLSIKSTRIVKILLLLSTVSLFGCYTGGPGDRPSITGDVAISLNDKGDMCFQPLLNTAVTNDTFISVNYLKMQWLGIYNTEQTENEHRRIIITPANDLTFDVYNNQKVCINNDNPDLKQEVFASFNKKEKLIIHMTGYNDDETDVYNTSFSKQFEYPYTPE